MEYDINKRVFCTICQKCNAKPTKTPLTDLELTPGVIFVPDILHCANCGAQLTTQVRDLRKDELEERDKCVGRTADVTVLDEFAATPQEDDDEVKNEN